MPSSSIRVGDLLVLLDHRLCLRDSSPTKLMRVGIEIEAADRYLRLAQWVQRLGVHVAEQSLVSRYEVRAS